jgi:creatinine amidohydrolase
MLLQHATWPEVEAAIAAGKTGIIIPIGSTEQHGRTALVGTDALCAEAAARSVGEAMGLYVAPTIAVGMAQHHLGFAGSITLRPSTLMAVVIDTVTSLARHGFTHCLFVNGHGGNVVPVEAAFAELYAGWSLAPEGPRPRVRCQLLNYYEMPSLTALEAELYGGANGQHATCGEVSITQHLLPHVFGNRIGMVSTPRVAPPYAPWTDADDYRRLYPDGRIGSDPSLARPEHGARLLAAAVEGLSAAMSAFLKEPA